MSAPIPFSLTVGSDKFTFVHQDKKPNGIVDGDEKVDVTVEPKRPFEPQSLFPKFTGLPINKWRSAHESLIGAQTGVNSEKTFTAITQLAIDKKVDLDAAKKLAQAMIDASQIGPTHFDGTAANRRLTAYYVAVVALSLKNKPFYKGGDVQFADKTIEAIGQGKLKIGQPLEKPGGSYEKGVFSLGSIDPQNPTNRGYVVHELFHLYEDLQPGKLSIRDSENGAYAAEARHSIAEGGLSDMSKGQKRLKSPEITKDPIKAATLELALLRAYEPGSFQKIQAAEKKVNELLDMDDVILRFGTTISKELIRELEHQFNVSPMRAQSRATIGAVIPEMRKAIDPETQRFKASLPKNAQPNETFNRSLEDLLRSILLVYFLESAQRQIEKNVPNAAIRLVYDRQDPQLRAAFKGLLPLNLSNYFYKKR